MSNSPQDPLSSSARDLEQRLADLAARGVTILDPRQTYVAEDVVPARICEGAVLHPGTRLSGARLFVGPRAQVGTEGPATLIDAALGEGAQVASGYVHGAVLLAGAKVGANAHLRPGTLLEEQVSTAHCVGLKHTILLAYVTLGSLINFCDCLMAGGTSRRDHSEVGSGFIHFNFTPWGKRGDKATPSLFGNVVDGVFLDQRRIFLGGSAGVIGPRRVGFGAITGAGQVVRRDVDNGQLALQPLRALTREVDRSQLDSLAPRLERNLEYIAQLTALQAWYRGVRLARVGPGPAQLVVHQAVATLDTCLSERRARVVAFAKERGAAIVFAEPEVPPCPCAFEPDGVDHLTWVQGLGPEPKQMLRIWLAKVVAATLSSVSIVDT